jgi:membrane protease YdiL (CAAX protease family)
MNRADPFPAGTEHRQTPTQRHPIAAFLLLAFLIGVPGLVIPLLAGIPLMPFLLLLVFVALLGSSLLVTWRADGPAGIRRLLSRVVQWRFSAWRWAIILFGVPVLTVALAAASGTLVSPERGWVPEIGWYLFNTLIFGALTLNLWEETAWAGFAQTRWMARHGLLTASLITAVFFAAIHVPLQFEGDPSGPRILASIGVVLVTALFARYLIGMHLLDTRGSILAVGIQHASWNASQKIEAVQGGVWEWQMVAAVALLTAIVAVGRRLHRPETRPFGLQAEKAAAAQWIDPAAPRGPAQTHAESVTGSTTGAR